MNLVNAIRKTPDTSGIYEYIENVRQNHLDTDNWEISPDVSALDDVPRKFWKWNDPGVVEMSAEEKLVVNTKLMPELAQYAYAIQNSGRFYCYSDNRWITSGDDNYGSNYYQFAESGGTKTDPVIEWEQQGVMVARGETIRKFTINARANSNDVDDFQIQLVARYPKNSDKWRSGLTGDGNMTNEVIADDLFFDPVDTTNWDLPFSGNMNTFHRRTVSVDYQFPTDGWLSLFIKPIGDISSTRYILSTFRYDIIGVSEETQL